MFSKYHAVFNRFENLVERGIYIPDIDEKIKNVEAYLQLEPEGCENDLANMMANHRLEPKYSVQDFLDGMVPDGDEISGSLLFDESYEEFADDY
jgi:hypothetical protein